MLLEKRVDGLLVMCSGVFSGFSRFIRQFNRSTNGSDGLGTE